MPVKIPLNEIKFNNTSYVDPNSRVFSWQGRIFRAVMPKMNDFYDNLVEQSWFKNLQNRGLVIETEKTDFELEGFGRVFEHRKIQTISYGVGWPRELLKSAALLTVELSLELLEHNFCLQDAYPWNIFFEGTKPVLIDVGSICPFDDRFLWVPYQQFCNFFLFPLYLYSAGIDTPTRMMLYNYLDGISDEITAKLLPAGYRLRNPNVIGRLDFPRLISSILVRFKMTDRLNDLSKNGPCPDFAPARKSLFRGLQKEISSIKFPRIKTQWADYDQGEMSLADKSQWTRKQKAVDEILDRLKPETVLDVAANRGWFAMLAAKKGASVIAFDRDEGAVNQMTEQVINEKLNVMPLVMNILNPTPPFGWCSKQFPSAQDRISGDLTMGLALIHHLVFSQWQNFHRICETLDPFTNKWLLLEYIPKSDEKVKLLLSRKTDTFEWYSMENLKNALGTRFEDFQEFDSYPEGRKLLLCRKKT